MSQINSLLDTSDRFIRVPMFPVGVPFPWFNSTFPESTMECNGQTFDVNTFTELAKIYPTGQLPDLRGVVLRGLDRGSGRDLDGGVTREAGSYQADEFKSHQHTLNRDTSGGGGTGADTGNTTTGLRTTNATGGTETRMKNVGCYWLVFTTNVAFDSQLLASNAYYLGGLPSSAYLLKQDEKRGYKNYIINGNFDLWQRAASQTSAGYGSDDRWNNYHNGSTKVHSYQSFTPGQTEVPGNPKFFSRTVVTSVAGAGNFTLKAQFIEDVTLLSGKTVTLSFWAKADSPKNIAVEFGQYFGIGGSPSVYELGTTLVALTTSWKKYTVTVSIPSVLGKTIGTTNYTGVYFWYESGSTYASRSSNIGQQSGTFDIAQVQLEDGDRATPYEYRPLSVELQLCQRYYEYGVIYEAGYQNSGNGVRWPHPYKVTKRVAPTIEFINVAYSNCNNLISGTTGIESFHSQVVAASTGVLSVTATWKADSELS